MALLPQHCWPILHSITDTHCDTTNTWDAQTCNTHMALLTQTPQHHWPILHSITVGVVSSPPYHHHQYLVWLLWPLAQITTAATNPIIPPSNIKMMQRHTYNGYPHRGTWCSLLLTQWKSLYIYPLLFVFQPSFPPLCNKCTVNTYSFNCNNLVLYPFPCNKDNLILSPLSTSNLV